jgi:peptide/nickel transport system ATP-binding protein
VEEGPTDIVLTRPAHPYTVGLLRSIPSRGRRGEALAQIQGNAPSPFERPSGCAFRPRCPRASERCLAEPKLAALADGRTAACFHPFAEAALQ